MPRMLPADRQNADQQRPDTDWQRECDHLAQRILDWCAGQGLKIACAESLTGGLLADAWVRIPGASAVFLGSAVTYDIRAKASILGVDAALLAREGAVHPEVARQMAAATARLYAQPGYTGVIGLSTTGVAGPGPDGNKPAGLVYVGLSLPASCSAVSALTAGDTVAVLPSLPPIAGGHGTWASVTSPCISGQEAVQSQETGQHTVAAELRLSGDRPQIRRAVVLNLLRILCSLSGNSQE